MGFNHNDIVTVTSDQFNITKLGSYGRVVATAQSGTYLYVEFLNSTLEQSEGNPGEGPAIGRSELGRKPSHYWLHSSNVSKVTSLSTLMYVTAQLKKQGSQTGMTIKDQVCHKVAVMKARRMEQGYEF